VAEYRAIFSGAGADLTLLGALPKKSFPNVADRRDGYTLIAVFEVKKKTPVNE